MIAAGEELPTSCHKMMIFEEQSIDGEMIEICREKTIGIETIVISG